MESATKRRKVDQAARWLLGLAGDNGERLADQAAGRIPVDDDEDEFPLRYDEMEVLARTFDFKTMLAFARVNALFNLVSQQASLWRAYYARDFPADYKMFFNPTTRGTIFDMGWRAFYIWTRLYTRRIWTEIELHVVDQSRAWQAAVARGQRTALAFFAAEEYAALQNDLINFWANEHPELEAAIRDIGLNERQRTGGKLFALRDLFAEDGLASRASDVHDTLNVPRDTMMFSALIQLALTLERNRFTGLAYMLDGRLGMVALTCLFKKYAVVPREFRGNADDYDPFNTFEILPNLVFERGTRRTDDDMAMDEEDGGELETRARWQLGVMYRLFTRVLCPTHGLISINLINANTVLTSAVLGTSDLQKKLRNGSNMPRLPADEYDMWELGTVFGTTFEYDPQSMLTQLRENINLRQLARERLFGVLQDFRETIETPDIVVTGDNGGQARYTDHVPRTDDGTLLVGARDRTPRKE